MRSVKETTYLKADEFRCPVLKHGVIPEAAGFQDFGGEGKVFGDVCRVVGVAAYGDDLSPKLPIAF